MFSLTQLAFLTGHHTVALCKRYFLSKKDIIKCKRYFSLNQVAFRIGYHMVAFLPTANLLPDTDRCKDNINIVFRDV